MEQKLKKKSQSELAMQALFQAVKATTAIASFIIAYFSGWGPITLTLMALIVFYYVFVVIEKNIIMTLLKYYRRAIKFRKIHSFIEQVDGKQMLPPIRQFFDNNVPERKRKHRKKETNQEVLDTELDGYMEYFSYIPSKIDRETMKRSQRDRPETESQRKEYQKQYLTIRDQYKKSFIQIFGKQELRQQFEGTLDKIRSYYLRKVSELLIMNEANLIQMKQQLEKHYQVQILVGQDEEKALNVVPVSIDDAIMRLIQYKQKKCFPWTQKSTVDDRSQRDHIAKVQRITEDRRQIDSFLAPYYPLDQKMREEVVEALEDQMKQTTKLGKQLAYTVCEIWNDHLKNNQTAEKYFIYQQNFTTRPCLQLVESKIYNRFHLDLLVKRAEKEQKIICNPGSNNLWTLIAFAVEVIKQKR